MACRTRALVPGVLGTTWASPDTVAGLSLLAITTTVTALLVAAAAVLLILVIRQVNAWQSSWLGQGAPAGQQLT